MSGESQKLANSIEAGNPDDASRFIRLFMGHERQLRFYLHHLLPDQNDVDEVMQNTSIVLWTKFESLENDDGFLKWAYVVARYEVLMYRRDKARDRLLLDSDLLNAIALEFADDPVSVHEYQGALRACLDKLVEQDRKLIVQSYGHGLKVAQLAAELRRSVQSIYRKLTGLREQLARCVKLRVEG